MTRNLYALLVGIDEYDEQSHVSSLQGCLNDVQKMQAYLQGRINRETFDLHLHVLTNEQATRQGVIDGFRQHLAQAGKEDVALFYYAGYGSEAAAPEAFWLANDDRMMKTLVCYDSRVGDECWDLADKELARLVTEIEQNGPHTVVVLDCGYSGIPAETTQTEPKMLPLVATRHINPDLRSRAVKSFIVSPSEAELFSLSSKHQQDEAAMKLPVGCHIVLSACSAIEQAQEYYGGGEPQGAFSYFLQTALAQTKGASSYQNLIKRTNVLVRSHMPAQSPQMSAPNKKDLRRPFLDGAIAPSPTYFTASHHPVDGWIIDGGAIHGLVPSKDTETTTLALFPYYSPRSQMQQIEEAIAQAEVTQVWPQFSKIKSSGLAEANPTDLFKAIVVKLPLPAVSVFIEGESAGTETLQRALAIAGPNSQRSPYVKATDQINGARLRVHAANGTYAITTPAGVGEAAQAESRLLTSTISGNAAAAEVVKALEHIAKWQAIAQFTSPATSQIQGTVELKIYTGNEANEEAATEITTSQIRLTYKGNPQYSQRDPAQIPPRFRIKLHNQSNQPLYCALLYLTERFKSAAIKPDSINSIIRLMPDQEVWVAGGAPLNGRVPDAIWQQGITECQDIFKLIACTEAFDPTLLNLGELGKAAYDDIGVPRSATGDISLIRLMQRVHQRHASSTGTIPTYDDWTTNQVALTFIRPQLFIPLSSHKIINIGAANKATASVAVHPHPLLQAHVRLSTPTQAMQDVGNHIRPPLLPAKTRPFQFTQSRASAPGLSTLELSHITNPESVTPEQPLRLETDMPLGEDRCIFPTAHDGEFYIPLGYSKTQNGKTHIVIERLTPPIKAGQQSEQGSIHIFFQQVMASRRSPAIAQDAGQITRADVEYPQLRAARISADGSKAVYINNEENIRANIAKAKTITLYVHGLFTDTAAILSEVAIASISHSAAPPYDLILAFDYDTINTPLDQNARLLKRHLESLGLGKGHPKKLHIIAHSTGGLLARWFVEKEGGQQIASHLTMLGTPNAGASWNQIKAGTTAAIAFAINGLSHNASSDLNALGGFLKQLETQSTVQDQIQPGSDFLNALANPLANSESSSSTLSEHSAIPYTLVMGNTLLMPADDKAALRQRLMGQLGAIANMPFFSQPNDMAVSASSAIALSQTQAPLPKLQLVACDHLGYFSHPASVSALIAAAARALTEQPANVKDSRYQLEPILRSKPPQQHHRYSHHP